MNRYDTTPGAPERNPLDIHADAVRLNAPPTQVGRLPLVFSDADGKRTAGPSITDDPTDMWGDYTFTDVEDFAAWVDAYGIEHESTLWRDDRTIVAVLNDHSSTAGAGGWADHRGTLRFTVTPGWERWSQLDRKLVDQDAFADIVEMGLAEVNDPTASDLLELVREFHATADTKFTSAKTDATGAGEFVFVDEITGQSRSGQIKTPATITLFLAVYEGTEPMLVEARFRFRLDRQSRKVSFGLVFPRSAAEYRRDAIMSAAGQITTVTSLPVWGGSAPASRVPA